MTQFPFILGLRLNSKTDLYLHTCWRRNVVVEIYRALSCIEGDVNKVRIIVLETHLFSITRFVHE